VNRGWCVISLLTACVSIHFFEFSFQLTYLLLMNTKYDMVCLQVPRSPRTVRRVCVPRHARPLDAA
jgi:hypothetical protein